MAKIYFRQIKRGAITLESVPARWREQVGEMLRESESQSESEGE